MLRVQYREFATSVIARATAPTRGKAQGFAKKMAGNRSVAKRITPGTLYKKWPETMHTAKLNQNAISVFLPNFDPAVSMKETLNKVSTFSEEQYRALYHLGSFKKSQFNELFPKPISLIRENSTAQFMKLLKSEENKKFILTGEPGVGKSVLLSQIHASASGSNTVIINVSNPDLFLNGRNDFFYDEALKQYVQPMYLKKLLRKILKANDEKMLRSIQLNMDYKFSNSDPKDSAIKKFVNLAKGKNTLFDLLSIKTQARHRGDLLKAVVSELSTQEQYPVLVTVDNFSRILTGPFSAYKNVDNENIHLLELQAGKTIMDIVGGDIKFPHKDSSVVLAISGTDRTNQTLPVGLGKLTEDVYTSKNHYEPKFAEILKKGNVQEFQVPKLNKEEVKELLEFYLKSEVVLNRDAQTKTLEQLTDEKYFMSGNGNPRELIKSIVLTHN